MSKMHRRQFARYLTHSALAAAFFRTLISERAMGAVPGKNLVIFSHPNGHKSWQLTQQAVAASGMANRALLSTGMFYNTSGISHGGACNLLRFRANTGGSFDADLGRVMGVNTVRVGIDFNPNQNADIMCRDANGQLAQIFDSPQRAFMSLFGQSATPISPGAQQDIYAGKKSVVDACLDDVNRIRRDLGSLGPLFDDNLAALVELQKEIIALQAKAAEDAPPPAPPAQCTQAPIVYPAGTSISNYDAYFNVMTEIIYQAIVCNRTQLAVMQMSNAQSDLVFNFGNSPVNTNAGFHGGLVHGTNRGTEYQDIISWYVRKVAGFAGRLARTGGDVLASSAVLHVSEMGIADHSTTDIPFIVYGELGGTIRTGRTIAGNQAVSSFLKSASDSMFGPVVGQGIAPMGGLG